MPNYRCFGELASSALRLSFRGVSLDSYFLFPLLLLNHVRPPPNNGYSLLSTDLTWLLFKEEYQALGRVSNGGLAWALQGTSLAFRAVRQEPQNPSPESHEHGSGLRLLLVDVH